MKKLNIIAIMMLALLALMIFGCPPVPISKAQAQTMVPFEMMPDGLGHTTDGDFMAAHFDEAWAIISQDFLDGKGKTPLGFDLASLNQDLQAVQQTAADKRLP